VDRDQNVAPGAPLLADPHIEKTLENVGVRRCVPPETVPRAELLVSFRSGARGSGAGGLVDALDDEEPGKERAEIGPPVHGQGTELDDENHRSDQS
jgi:hypothetical protein